MWNPEANQLKVPLTHWVIRIAAFDQKFPDWYREVISNGQEVIRQEFDGINELALDEPIFKFFEKHCIVMIMKPQLDPVTAPTGVRDWENKAG